MNVIVKSSDLEVKLLGLSPTSTSDGCRDRYLFSSAHSPFLPWILTGHVAQKLHFPAPFAMSCSHVTTFWPIACEHYVHALKGAGCASISFLLLMEYRSNAAPALTRKSRAALLMGQSNMKEAWAPNKAELPYQPWTAPDETDRREN